MIAVLAECGAEVAAGYQEDATKPIDPAELATAVASLAGRA